MNVLLVDVGNTRLKWRLVSSDGTAGAGIGRETETIVAGGSVALDASDQLAAEWEALGLRRLAAAFVSNVAAARHDGLVRDAVGAVWGTVPVKAVRAVAEQCGVVSGYDEPSGLGPDRWLALIGAHALAPDRPVLVCSFGTATTIDLLEPRAGDRGRRANFVGGIILPGSDAMRTALSTGTARLPLGNGRVTSFAAQTDDAIASGIVAAQVGAVERALRDAETRRAHRGPTNELPVVCLLAGGGAATMAPFVVASSRTDATASGSHRNAAVHVVADLVLQGLAVVAFDTPTGARPVDAFPRADPLGTTLPLL